MRRTFNFLFNLGEEIKAKKLSIGFLIDLSGSMQGEPLYNLKNALIQILNPLIQYNSNLQSTDAIHAADEVMLMTFATDVQKVCPWVKQDDYDFFKELLLAVPEAIFGKSGCTALYDGIIEILNEFTKAEKDNEKILIIFSDGGEYGSRNKKSDVTNLIIKYQQGYLTESQYQLIAKKIDKTIIDSLVQKVDEDYVFKVDFLQLIEKAQLDDILKNEIKEYQRNSVTKVRIFSLFYVGGGYTGDFNLLNEFGKLTDGEVYNSPQEESIPVILNEMIMDILYDKKSSLRAKLYRRLTSSSNVPWYKLFSFNSVTEEKDNCSFSNNYTNPIYYIKSDVKKSREEHYKLFNQVFTDQIFSDLKKCIEDNGKKLPPHIDKDVNVFIVLRSNDKLGISSAEYLYKYIRNNIAQLIDPTTKVWTKIVILLEKFKNYEGQERERGELYAFLNEINQTQVNEIDTIYLISDYNKYAHNSKLGFIYLEKHQYEDLAAEILFDLNYNQDLANKIIGGTVDLSGQSSRFVAIGGSSAYLNKNEYIDSLTNIFTVDFLSKLFNNEKLPFDENFVKEKLQEFFNQISYDVISKRLIDCYPQTDNMFQQLSCPDINQFTPFRNEISLKIYNKKDPRLDKVSITRNYFNFVEYITLLYYDVIDYIDSSHSIEFFEAELDRRLDELFKEHYGKLKIFVDSVLYGNDKYSSPLAAKAFTEGLYKYLKEKIDNTLVNEFENDQIKKIINLWRFKNSEGVIVPPGNPSEDINELRKIIENFPLPWSIRFRYYGFGFLLSSILFSIFWLFGLDLIGIIPALLPVGGFIAWAEYKIRKNYNKLKNIINKYEDTHKYYTWGKAFGIYCEKIKSFYELLKDKVKREDISTDDPFLSNQYTENELLDLFSTSCNKTIPVSVIREDVQEIDTDKFHISLKPYIFKDLFDRINDKESEQRLIIKSDIIDEMKKLGLDLRRLENPKQLLTDILTHQKTFSLREFPGVIIGPIPINLKNLSEGLQSKLDIIPIIKDKEYQLTLLQDLTDEEKKELINVWKDDYWEKVVEKLILLRKNHNQVQNNLFVLWREIVRYEIWLKKIKDLIIRSIKNSGELESKFKFDNVFYAWKDMYYSRSKFKEGLNQVFNIIAQELVDANFDIWKIILELKNKTNIHILINGNSYPALSVIATNSLEYPSISNYYSANDSLSIVELEGKMIELKNVFPARTTIDDWEFTALSLDDDQVFFNKVYYLNLSNAEKYSIFNLIFDSFTEKYNVSDSSAIFDKIKDDNKLLNEIFLEDFKNLYLKDERSIKKFHFIGEVTKSNKR